MVEIPQTVQPVKPWDTAVVPRESAPEATPFTPVSTAAVPRKAISVADFASVKREVDEAKDMLFVPESLKQKDIAIEWKRVSVLNKEDKKHRAEVYRAGWRFVPSNSVGFAEHFASFIAGDIFEYEGLALMYRPQTMSDAARKEENRKAGALVQDKFEEMGMKSNYTDIPGKRFKLERGFEEKLPGGNPAAVAVPE
jgi:hypothetical protein